MHIYSILNVNIYKIVLIHTCRCRIHLPLLSFGQLYWTEIRFMALHLRNDFAWHTCIWYSIFEPTHFILLCRVNIIMLLYQHKHSDIISTCKFTSKRPMKRMKNVNIIFYQNFFLWPSFESWFVGNHTLSYHF